MTENTPPTDGEYLETSNAVATDGEPPPNLILLATSSPALLSQGFFAQAFLDNNGNVIVAYDNTLLPGDSGGNSRLGPAYANGTKDADLQLLAGHIPNALIDAATFLKTVAGDESGKPIFVTGHSLGGAEAEWAAAQAPGLGVQVSGGHTFGAPGIAGGGTANLIDYVDYGDPIGNFDSNMDPGNLYTPRGVTHVGEVRMVGSQASAGPLKADAVAYNSDLKALANALLGHYAPFGILSIAKSLLALAIDIRTTFDGQLSFHNLVSSYFPDLGYALLPGGIVLRLGPGSTAPPIFGVDQIENPLSVATFSDQFSNTGQLQELSIIDTDGTTNVLTLGGSGQILGQTFNPSGQLTATIQVNSDNSEVAIFYNLIGGLFSTQAFNFNTVGQLISISAVFPNGDSITLGPDDFTNSLSSSNVLDTQLTTSDGAPLGTLLVNATTDTGTLTLLDGAVIDLNSIPAQAILIDPPGSPEQVLLNYLSQLGDPLSASQLDQLNFDTLNPPASATYTVPGYVVPNADDTAANIFFTPNAAPGAVIAGQGNSVVISYFDPFLGRQVRVVVPATNILQAFGSDLAQDSISGIDVLEMSGAVRMTADEFYSFGTIENAYPGLTDTIVAATPGTYSLAAGNIHGSFNLTATDWGGTTLIGNDQNDQILTASLFGNDTLIAGNGLGDELVAGEGIDTLVGGLGGDTFLAGRAPFVAYIGPFPQTSGLAAGSVVEGHGGGNTLQAFGDISGATITGIQTLETNNVTLTVNQFDGFSLIIGFGLINAATGGTYDLAAKTAGRFNLTAESDDGTVLIANDAGFETLTASPAGNDTLVAGAGAGDILDASGTSSTESLIGGPGANDVLNARNSAGDNALTAGTGAGTTLDVSESSGNNTLDGTNAGANATLNASDSTGDNTLIAGPAAGFQLIAESSSGDNVLDATRSNGGATLDIRNSDGDNRLTTGLGSGYVLNADDSDGSNVLDASRATAASTLSAVGSFGDNTLIVGSTGTGYFLTATASFGDNVLISQDVAGNPLVTFGPGPGGTPGGPPRYFGNTLTANSSSGDNTLTAGDANGDVLSASGGFTPLSMSTAFYSTGNNVLTAGNGADDFLAASFSSGTNILRAGNGAGDTLFANNSIGNNSLIAGDGSSDQLSAQISIGANSLTAGGGDNDEVIVDESTGDNKLTAGNGNSDYLSASVTTGNNTLTAGDGNGDEEIAAASSGSNILSLGNGARDTIDLTGYSHGANTVTVGDGAQDLIDGRSSTGDNTFTVGNGAGDILYAGDGNDTLKAGDGDGDVLFASNGDNSQTFPNGFVQQSGGGNDTLTVGDGDNDVLHAGSGNDVLTAGNGNNDILYGGSGNDTLSVGNGANDALYAGTGTSTLIAGGGTDTLYAGTGVDDLRGGAGTTTFVLDQLVGNGPPTVLPIGTVVVGGSGTNIVKAEDVDISHISISGVPTLIADAITLTSSQLADFNSIKSLDDQYAGVFHPNTFISAATGGTYSLVGINTPERITLIATSPDGTTLLGNDDFLEALQASPSGNDTLIAGNGDNNLLFAGGGTDTLIAGSGNADGLFTGSGTDTLIGGSGNDFFAIGGPTGRGTVIKGGRGSNTLTVGNAVPLGGAFGLNPTIDITGVSISGVATLIAGNVTLTATQLAAFASIQSVDDSIAFLGEPASTPFITAATPGTYSLAGKGKDLIDLAAPASGDVTLIGNDANGEILRDSGSGNDTLIAGNGIGDILGAKLSTGNDLLVAGSGADVLIGGTGNDTFDVGSGNDTLVGGSGTNTAVFSGNIADYRIVYSAANSAFTVTGGPSGATDNVTGIDIFQFANGTLTYDAQGDLVSRTSRNLNGTLETDAYDAQGDLVSQTYGAANGSSWINAYDPQGTGSWVWSSTEYDPRGNLLSQTGLNADGTHWLTLYDADNQYSWLSATITFDSQWNWLSVTGTNHDGSHNISEMSAATAYDTLLWYTAPYDPNARSKTSLTLTAGAGNDVLAGHAGNDTLVAGTGDDVLYGNGGSNTFVFGTNFGQDTVMDFNPRQDTLKFSSALFSSYAAAMTTATQVGTDTVFSIAPSESVTLRNVNRGSLAASNFAFA
jgi:Ca2+-binding RTX toxin-like protein